MTFKLKFDHFRKEVMGFGNREGWDLMTQNELCQPFLSMQYCLSVHCHQYIAMHFADGPRPECECASAKCFAWSSVPTDLAHIALQSRMKKSVDKTQINMGWKTCTVS